MSGLKFIRVNGRVVPIREKSYQAKKTVSRGIVERAGSGVVTGAKVGAVTGLAIGLLGPKVTKFPRFVEAGMIGSSLALNWGAWGGLLGAAFGSRKGQVTVTKKKYSSV